MLDTLHRMAQSRQITNVRDRLAQDPELAQAFTRVVITSLVAAVLAVRAIIIQSTLFENLALAIGAYFFYAMWHCTWVAVRPGAYRWRRVMGIIGDQAACTATFVIGGEHAFAFFLVYVWVCVGNGVRFGAWYMYIATLAAAFGFGLAVLLRGLATTHLEVVLGIFVCIVALPLFVRKLFSQLESAHELLQQQATQLRYEATHDRLTGLVNRTVFFDRLNRILARSDRRYVRCAVIYFDLDDFKDINDTFGHAVGDECLREIATRVIGKIRKCDTLCRLSGDEFAIIAEDVAREQEAAKIAETVLATVRSIDIVAGKRVRLSTSIGIAVYGGGGAPDEDAASLVNRADTAMYASKRGGRGRYSAGAAQSSRQTSPHV